MPYNAKAAVRILTFVNKASQNICEDLAWIIYMQDVRTQYMGRGLPMKDLFDVELVMSAKRPGVSTAWIEARVCWVTGNHVRILSTNSGTSTCRCESPNLCRGIDARSN
jgi:hypothetical protein